MIHAPCGYGKTTYVKNPNGLLADINKRKEELGGDAPSALENMLMLVPRAAIREQQNYGGVLVKTYHSFLNDKDVDVDKVQILICDEAHCPYDETYAEKYEDFFRFLEMAGSRIIKIYLTATPEPLEEFHEVRYKKINLGEIPPKYYAKEIFISFSGSVDGVLETYIPSINDTRKALVFLNSAKQCELQATKWNKREDKGGNADFQISIYSTQRNADGAFLKDLMNEAARRIILDEERLPQDVIIEFFTKAFDTGVNIADDKVGMIIIQAFNPATIIQEIGRFRGNLQLVVLILDFYGANKAIADRKKMYEARKAYEKLDTNDIAGRAATLARLYERQLVGDFPFAIKKIDECHFEWSRRGWNSVNNNAYWGHVALNFRHYYQTGCYEYHGKYMFTTFDLEEFERPLEDNVDFYRNLLTPYSRTRPQIVNFNKLGEQAREIRNDNWVEKFKEEGKEWLDKKLFKEEQDALVEKWGQRFVRTERRKAGIETILEILEKSKQYKIKRGKAINKSTKKQARYIEISLV